MANKANNKSTMYQNAQGRIPSFHPQNLLRRPFFSFFIWFSTLGNSIALYAISSTIGLHGNAWKGGGNWAMRHGPLVFGSPIADS